MSNSGPGLINISTDEVLELAIQRLPQHAQALSAMKSGGAGSSPSGTPTSPSGQTPPAPVTPAAPGGGSGGGGGGGGGSGAQPAQPAGPGQAPPPPPAPVTPAAPGGGSGGGGGGGAQPAQPAGPGQAPPPPPSPGGSVYDAFDVRRPGTFSFVSSVLTNKGGFQTYVDRMLAAHSGDLVGSIANKAFTHEDPILGSIHVGKGEDAAEALAVRQRQAAARAAGIMSSGIGAMSAWTHPTHSLGADLASAAGGGLMTSGIASGNLYLAAGGAAVQGLAAIDKNTRGALLGKGMEYASLGRPLEQMAHAGFGSLDQGKRSASFGAFSEALNYTGYSESEKTVISAEALKSFGKKLTSAEAAQMRDFMSGEYGPFSAELKGISRGTTNFLGSMYGVGGGARGGITGAAQGVAYGVQTADQMGLSGDKATEFLQRIASTLEGFRERGMPIQEGTSLFASAERFSAAGLAAASGNQGAAYLQGARAATVAGRMASFGADTASNMLNAAGSFDSLARGALLHEAARRARQKHGVAGWENTRVEMQSIAENNEALDIYQKQFGGNRDVMFGLLTSHAGGGMNAKEAQAFLNGNGAVNVQNIHAAGNIRHMLGKAFGAFSGQDETQVGAGQGVLASRAAEEAKLVTELSSLTKQIEQLNKNLGVSTRRGIEIGGVLTGTGSVAGVKQYNDGSVLDLFGR